MPSAAQVRHEDDGDDVADLIAARYEAGQTGRDLEPLLYSSYHRVNVARAQSLLQRHQKRQQQHEHLKVNVADVL